MYMCFVLYWLEVGNMVWESSRCVGVFMEKIIESRFWCVFYIVLKLFIGCVVRWVIKMLKIN